MEETMSYILQPTLQHMSMAKIAVAFWIRDDLLTLIPKTDNREDQLFQDDIEIIIKMRENVQNLHLPEQLKSELLTFIKPIGRQIVQWYQYFHHKFHLERRNPPELRWTSAGTIDIKESVLVQNQSLDVLQRYELACCYCFTLEMHELRKEIGQEGLLGLVKDGHKQKLVVFWDCYLRNKTRQLRRIIDEDDPDYSPAEYGFKCAVLSVNPTAMAYFFVKLKREEKQMALGLYPGEILKLVYSLCGSKYDDPTPLQFYSQALCFFLSRMNRNQRGKLFRNCVEASLECFLFWPYHHFFVSTAEQVRLFIRPDDFGILLSKMQRIFMYNNYAGGGRNVYREIFREFWRSSPRELKKHVLTVDHDYILELLIDFFNAGEKGLCRWMLRDADAEEKEQLIDDGDPAFMGEIRHGNLDFLKFMLEECAPTAPFVERVKASLLQRKSSFEAQRRKALFQILDTYLLVKKKDVEKRLVFIA